MPAAVSTAAGATSLSAQAVRERAHAPTVRLPRPAPTSSPGTMNGDPAGMTRAASRAGYGLAMSPSVLIADDQALVRAGFRAILDGHERSPSSARQRTGSTPSTSPAAGSPTSC